MTVQPEADLFVSGGEAGFEVVIGAGDQAPPGDGSYFWPATEASENEEEGGEWAAGGPVDGVSGGEGLPPTAPDWTICCLSWLMVRSSFSLASRSLRSSSCSSCRSASACSSL